MAATAAVPPALLTGLLTWGFDWVEAELGGCEGRQPISELAEGELLLSPVSGAEHLEGLRAWLELMRWWVEDEEGGATQGDPALRRRATNLLLRLLCWRAPFHILHTACQLAGRLIRLDPTDALPSPHLQRLLTNLERSRVGGGRAGQRERDLLLGGLMQGLRQAASSVDPPSRWLAVLGVLQARAQREACPAAGSTPALARFSATCESDFVASCCGGESDDDGGFDGLHPSAVRQLVECPHRGVRGRYPDNDDQMDYLHLMDRHLFDDDDEDEEGFSEEELEGMELESEQEI